MTDADLFKQYADEAMAWARIAKTDDEMLAALNLAAIWKQAFRLAAMPPIGDVRALTK